MHIQRLRRCFYSAKHILSCEAHLSGRVAALSPAGHLIARSAFTLLLLLCCGLVPGMAQNLTVCTGASFTIASIQDSDASATYQWTVNGADIPEATDVSYTDADGITEAGVYLFVRKAYTEECGLQVSNGFIVQVAAATAPGVTTTFAAFSPCTTAAAGATWTLQDTRDGGNNYTYKVKKMQDGRIWMVQDLKFGDCPNNTGYWYNDNSEAATTHTPTVYDGYVGHCRATSQANAGYLYNWPAAMQNVNAYYGSTDDSFQCIGTSGSGCQGICPDGWHIPTGAPDGEFQALHNAPGRNCSTSNDNCWNANSDWEGVYGGSCNLSGVLSNQGGVANYWSSTYYNNNNVYDLIFLSSITFPGTNNYYKQDGFSVRCVRNY
jgi:uncharacterized protein (TIGR02145 family)